MYFELEILLKFLLSLAIGGAVGFERETFNKPAGLRTYMLVCGSAALLTLLGPYIVEFFGPEAETSDPLRIVEAIIVGTSFIGAGTIIKNEGKVENLTTAAGLLIMAVIGIAVALSLYVVAIGGALLVIIVNRALWYFERNINRNTK